MSKTDLKPTLKTLLTVQTIDDKIKSLYEKKSQLSKKLLAKFGEGEFSYALEKPTIGGHKFIRLRITDNSKKLKEDNTLFKVAAFNAIEADVGLLKREPKGGL